MTDMSAYPKTRIERSAASSPYQGKHQRARAWNNRARMRDAARANARRASGGTVGRSAIFGITITVWILMLICALSKPKTVCVAENPMLNINASR
jgi:hypothetical protein